MSRALKAQLTSLREAAINPREEWVKVTRATILAQVRNTIVPERASFWQTLPRMIMELFSPQAMFKPLATILAVAVAASGWVATSKASRESLPGDTLYPVKIATEKTQLAWVSMMNDKTKSAQFHVELAGRRADEAKNIIANAPNKKMRVSETVDGIRQELTAAKQKLEDIKLESSPTLSQDVVTSIKQQTDGIKKSLQEVKISLQTSITTDDKLLSEQVADAKNAAKDTDVTTVQVAIADHLKANSALSKDYVNALIDTTLVHAVAEAGETKGSFAEVKTLVTEAAHDLSATSTEFEFGSLPLVTSSSNLLTSSPVSSTLSTSTPAENLKQAFTVVAGETAQAALKTQAATDQLTQRVSEVKQFLSVGDFSSASNKIQEVSDASKEVDKITDASIVKVQASLPEIKLLVSSASSSVSSTFLLKEKIDSALRSSTGPFISSTVSSSLSSNNVVSSSVLASSTTSTPVNVSVSSTSSASSMVVSSTVVSSTSLTNTSVKK